MYTICTLLIGKRWASGVGFFLCALAAGYGNAAAQAPITMELATYADTTLNQAYLKRFKQLMEETTDCEIRASIVPVGKARNAPRILSQIRDGDGLLYLVPPEKLTNIDPAYGVTLAPGLFASQAHAANSFLSKAFYKKYTELGEKKGVAVVGQYVNGPFTFFGSKPIKSFDDLKGLKMRVLGSPMETVIVRGLGGTSIANQFDAKTPPGVHSVIDMARSPMGEAVKNKWQKAAPTGIVSGIAYSSTLSIASAKWLKNLQRPCQEAINRIEQQMNKWAREHSATSHAKAKTEWVKTGGKVVPLPKAIELKLRSKAGIWAKEAYKDETARELYQLLMESAKNTAP